MELVSKGVELNLQLFAPEPQGAGQQQGTYIPDPGARLGASKAPAQPSGSLEAQLRSMGYEDLPGGGSPPAATQTPAQVVQPVVVQQPPTTPAATAAQAPVTPGVQPQGAGQQAQAAVAPAGQAPTQAAPQANLVEAQVGQLGQAVNLLTQLVASQQTKVSGPPEPVLPPEPKLPELPAKPPWLENEEAWRNHYQEDPAKAQREYMDWKIQTSRVEDTRQAMTSAYEQEKTRALQTHDLTLGFYDVMTSLPREEYDRLEPVASQLMRGGARELLQALPGRKAVAYAFEMAKRMAPASAPASGGGQGPAPAPATPAPAQGAQPAQGQGQPIPGVDLSGFTPEQLAAMEQHFARQYVQRLNSGQGQPAVIQGGGGVPPASGGRPIRNARDAKNAFLASVGLGGQPVGK